MLVWPALVLLVGLQLAGGLISFAGDALVLVLYLVLSAVAWELGYVSADGITYGEQMREDALEVLAWTLLVGACASAVVAFVQVLDVWEGVSWISRMPELRRPGSNLGQPNQLATLLLMGLASLLFLQQCGRLAVATAWLLFLLLCGALAATESRTGVLSYVLLMLWCLSGRWRSSLRISHLALASGGLLFLGLYLVWPLLMSSGDYYAQGAQVNTHAGLRLVVWPQLLEAVALRPWAGWGLREVSEAHNAVVYAHTVSEPFTYAHNIVLELAVGAGLPVTVLLLILVSVWGWRRLHAARALRSWYCVAAVLPVAVHSMLEFPFAYAYFLAPALFLLGALEALVGTKAAWHIGIKTAIAIVLLIGIVALWSVVEYSEIEEDFRVARFEALRIGQTPPEHKRPRVILLTQLSALLDGARIQPCPGMSAEMLALARKVAMRYPAPALQNRYALSLALNGQADEALRQLRVMRALHGEKTYAEIKLNWNSLAQGKYPQLRELSLP